MLHAYDEAFALGEVTSIVCSRACSAYLAEAYAGRPGHSPGQVPDVMGTWPAEP
jgi:hypothetical protein